LSPNFNFHEKILQSYLKYASYWAGGITTSTLGGRFQPPGSFFFPNNTGGHDNAAHHHGESDAMSTIVLAFDFDLLLSLRSTWAHRRLFAEVSG